MSTKNDGGPAFPFPSGPKNDAFHDVHEHSQGMSTRTWLVGMALQGFCANPEYRSALPDQIATLACAQADSTLKAMEEWEYHHAI
jgi:hypothetical protein